MMTRKESLALLKALADETRIELVCLLKERPRYTEELAAQLKLTPSTVSFHLNKLEQAGILSRAKEQYYTLYSLDETKLRMPLSDLLTFADERTQLLDTRLDAYRRKVLQTFMRGGRLRQLPTQKKKRLIVLEHFAGRFTPGRLYSEPEVDAVIEREYDDYCTIRRELVDEGLFRRANQQYERISGTETTAGAARRAPAQTQETPMDSYKDIKTRYKQTPVEAGVYQIRNLATGRFMLGSSLNLHGPWNKHRFVLSVGSHPNREMQKDWNTYGAGQFTFEILETVKEDPDVNTSVALEALEKSWSAKLDPYGEKGYNRFNPVKRIREA